jgi:hypothetical protein
MRARFYSTRRVLLGRMRVVAAIALAVVLPLLAPSSRAQESSVSEQQVKAAYLFKFGGYVEWPAEAFPDANAPIVIGVVGDEAVAREITRVVAKRTINGRSVVVQALRPGEAASGAHILFVGRSQLARIPELTAASHSALVVTDAEKGLAQGGTINFVTAENRIRFEVSMDAARRGGLKIGAPLLSVAMRVEG